MFAAQIVAEQSGALDKKIDRRGPANTQALNRYSYVQNNPLRWTDPTGHSVYLTQDEAAFYAGKIRELASALRENANSLGDHAAFEAVAGAFLAVLGPLKILATAVGGGGTANGLLPYLAKLAATELETFAGLIEGTNGDAGVIISLADEGNPWGDVCAPTCTVNIVNRETGNGSQMQMSRLAGTLLFSDSRTSNGSKRFNKWVEGRACTFSGDNPESGNYLKRDYRLCK